MEAQDTKDPKASIKGMAQKQVQNEIKRNKGKVGPVSKLSKMKEE
ncbi:hypothetical protein CCACVL1_18064 [Corchorus capsularis]|uniref:Uncharacterized protein n=1 Tax=Corchorus capsularis TaxID=210143 RepID=A0A1R3HN26_COCAP|nr:hypothetical protein CCACVL1_18064 [Corchorus capsularis]